MIYCTKCHKILMTIQESTYLEVRGEVTLVVFCQSCNEVNYINLFEYNEQRIR